MKKSQFLRMFSCEGTAKNLLSRTSGVGELFSARSTTCAIAAAAVEEVRSFTNLSPNVRPIANHSRRFSYGYQVFIQENVDKLLSDGIIQPAHLPGVPRCLLLNEENRNNYKADLKPMQLHWTPLLLLALKPLNVRIIIHLLKKLFLLKIIINYEPKS